MAIVLRRTSSGEHGGLACPAGGRQSGSMPGTIAIPLEALAPSERPWLRPLGLVWGCAGEGAGPADALSLAGGPAAFTAVELLARRGEVVATARAALPELRRWAAADQALATHIAARLAALSAPRPGWAGLALDRPRIMGIINVTPDSFADGGSHADAASAIAHGRTLLAAGADILDVGGESTRPGARPVTTEEEIRRVEPVIRALAETGAPVSVDTRHAAVMAAALAAGARIVNDVTALGGDKDSLALAAKARADLVLMHMQGEPATMQKEPHYALASLDVLEYLAARVAACETAGIPRTRVAIDPGIGFGKSHAHNLEILARLALFHALGCAVLIGLSRKSLIGRASHADVTQRLPGSLAGALLAIDEGVQIVRVHDVAATRQAILFRQAIRTGA
jgi:dihydropteroate synthase